MLKADLIKMAWRAGLAFKGPRVSRDLAPRLSYAGLCLGKGQPTHGGNVKLVALNSVFPEQPREFNLLYLVSSGLSTRSEAWAESSLRQGIRLVWNQNGVAYPAWTPKHHKRLNARMACLLHKASFVVYQSQFCKDTSDRFLGAFQGPSAVIYNAVDTRFFTSTGRGPREAAEPLRLLVMGSHESPGRVMAALEAVALLKKERVSVCLKIVGRLVWPKALPEIQEAVHRLHLEEDVEIQGPYSQQEAPDIYRSADILLHLKHADPCPSVVIEAMACGLPVVASGSGGLPELVGLEAGVLVTVPQDLDRLHVPPGESVAEGVMMIVRNLAMYASAARRRAEELFDTSLWLKKHQEIFEQVLRS